MQLLRELKNVLDALCREGWGEVLGKHGLDISVSLDKLESELSKPLLVDREVPGFEEFSLAGTRAIEKGQPALSLLYHALAFPFIYPPNASTNATPTFEQLDVVENYIYSREELNLAALADPVVSVFAYQYRAKDRTTHGQHADLVFSRTGIARIGNEAALYDPCARGFDPRPADGGTGFRALPCRFAAFIAERRTQPPNGSVLRGVPLDASLTFLFPVHKLFSGDVSLSKPDNDGNLRSITVPYIRFKERHISKKVAKIHQNEGGENPGFIPPMQNPEFDLAKPPFVRDSAEGHQFVTLVPLGASVLLEPVAAPIISLAKQEIANQDEIARFLVPKADTIRERPNRYWSTFEIPALEFIVKGAGTELSSRAAPEYVNIRQELVRNGQEFDLKDLNKLPESEFKKKVIDEGEYEAAHFFDNTCDGAVGVEPMSEIALPYYNAFSLVTAVDYFPRVDQIEIEEWVEQLQGQPIGMSDSTQVFTQGGPQPMSDGRFQKNDLVRGLAPSRQIPNCTLPDPCYPDGPAFSLDDTTNYTATAVVGNLAKSPGIPRKSKHMLAPTWLPDGASDYFAPGWDVSQHLYNNQYMYSSYGLGSPFPEDAKLCAALNSFWPAVAPDSSRTYGLRPPNRAWKNGRLLVTAVPLLDSELGYHPQHPRVGKKEVETRQGWDGDYGPFLMEENGYRFVNASNPMRADQTRAAFENRIGFSGLDQVTTDELIARMKALAWCRDNVGLKNQADPERAWTVNLAQWWLVNVEHVPNWASWQSAVFPKAHTKLNGPGLIFVLADVAPGEDVGDPPYRRRFPIKTSIEIQMAGPDNAQDGVRVAFARRDDGKFDEIGV